MNSTAFLEVFCLIKLSLGFSLSHLLIYYGFQFCFKKFSMYVNMCASASVCISCAFPMALFLCLFCPINYSILHCCCYYYLDVYVFYWEKKHCGFVWLGKWEGFRKSWRRENQNQNILYERKSIFNKINKYINKRWNKNANPHTHTIVIVSSRVRSRVVDMNSP